MHALTIVQNFKFNSLYKMIDFTVFFDRASNNL